MATKITVVRNPSTDVEFERAVNGLIDEGILDPDVFEARLAERYPDVVVRPRELAGEPTRTWYVYRDGHWVSGD